jgi:hypothetical protein
MNTWERLWRTAGLQFVGLTILAYVIYGDLPGIRATPDVLSFYNGDRMRVLIASVFSGLAVLNLMWLAAALRTTLADAGYDGWGAAATASSAAVGALAFVLIAIGAALTHSTTAALNDFAWTCGVLSSFPRAMLIMSSAFGLWRAKLISNALFTAGVAVVILGVLGGTTLAHEGLWAPDGAYSRFILPAISLVWVLVVSRILLTRAPATRAGW